MKLVPWTVLFIGVVSLAGCRANLPQISGKWQGAGQLDASYTTGSNPHPQHQSVRANFVFVL
jgi:hypothetical protein